MMRAAILTIVVACGTSTAAAQGPETADRVGTHDVTTGNFSLPSIGRVQLPPGPYNRANVGAGLGLSPEPIPYHGIHLGVPRNSWPVKMVLEFCEEPLINAALLSKRCPGTLLLGRDVIGGKNTEKAHDIPDDGWFDPRKRYVMIWRHAADSRLVVGYSNAVMFKPRTP